MTRPRLLLAVLLLVIALGVAWLLRPQRCLERSRHHLLAAIEARHARALGELLADDCADRWGYRKHTLVQDARLAFHHLDSIAIRAEDLQVGISGDRATISALLRVDMRGTDRAADARLATNALFSPFSFEWRRADTFPWGWELVQWDLPELDLNRCRRSAPGGY